MGLEVLQVDVATGTPPPLLLSPPPLGTCGCLVVYYSSPISTSENGQRGRATDPLSLFFLSCLPCGAAKVNPTYTVHLEGDCTLNATPESRKDVQEQPRAAALLKSNRDLVKGFATATLKLRHGPTVQLFPLPPHSRRCRALSSLAPTVRAHYSARSLPPRFDFVHKDTKQTEHVFATGIAVAPNLVLTVR